MCSTLQTKRTAMQVEHIKISLKSNCGAESKQLSFCASARQIEKYVSHRVFRLGKSLYCKDNPGVRNRSVGSKCEIRAKITNQTF